MEQSGCFICGVNRKQKVVKELKAGEALVRGRRRGCEPLRYPQLMPKEALEPEMPGVALCLRKRLGLFIIVPARGGEARRRMSGATRTDGGGMGMGGEGCYDREEGGDKVGQTER
ncbi:hypothetical protein SKAU_G00353030 [Synaphobranchus kaupii]|uniref:Uncharacterized protein n=1 Tax=Synaphobranchus kaupii TaxID=118154 RepID=A0A9Q1EKW5_SYNKA|nr:hypothetical protein SKAU_G00353030 [Synaphobranchus kaupii]